jgi:hypothetical protein
VAAVAQGGSVDLLKRKRRVLPSFIWGNCELVNFNSCYRLPLLHVLFPEIRWRTRPHPKAAVTSVEPFLASQTRNAEFPRERTAADRSRSPAPLFSRSPKRSTCPPKNWKLKSLPHHTSRTHPKRGSSTQGRNVVILSHIVMDLPRLDIQLSEPFP